MSIGLSFYAYMKINNWQLPREAIRIYSIASLVLATWASIDAIIFSAVLLARKTKKTWHYIPAMVYIVSNCRNGDLEQTCVILPAFNGSTLLWCSFSSTSHV